MQKLNWTLYRFSNEYGEGERVDDFSFHGTLKDAQTRVAEEGDVDFWESDLTFTDNNGQRYMLNAPEIGTLDELDVVWVKCSSCGEELPIVGRYSDFQEYRTTTRRHVQTIFPYLAPAERELLISRTCGECYAEMFGVEEDEDAEGKG